MSNPLSVIKLSDAPPQDEPVQETPTLSKRLRLLLINWREEDHFEYDWHVTPEQLAAYPTLEVTQLSAFVLSEPGRWREKLNFVRELYARSAAHDYIVCTENHRATQLVAALRTLRLLRRPFIIAELGVTRGSGGLRTRLIDAFLRTFYASADLVLFQSRAECELAQTAGLLGRKTQTDYARCCMFSGQKRHILAELEHVHSYPTPSDFTFAAGKSHRDYTALAEAAHDLPGKLCVMTPDAVAGAPWEHVRWGPYREYLAYLQAAKLIVIPLENNDNDCGINVLYEAWLLEKPVVIAATPTVKEYLRAAEEDVCLTYEPGNAKELRRCLSYAASHPEAMKATGKRAKRYLLSVYTSEHYLARFVRALERL